MISLNLTPSERAHEELLNIPTRLRQRDSKKFRMDILCKNLVGWPISLCLILVPLLSLWYPPAADFLMFVTSTLIVAYIFCDLFSPEREWHFYRLGIEIFAVLLMSYLLGKLVFSSQSDSIAEIFQQYGWVIWIYSLAYGLDLFPGIDRLGFWIMTSGVVAAAITLSITVTGQFPIHYFTWQTDPLYLSFATIYKTTIPLLQTVDWGSFCSILFAFCCLVLLMPSRSGNSYHWLLSFLAILFFAAILMSLEKQVWVCLTIALSATLLYGQRRFLLVLALFICLGWLFYSQSPELQNFWEKIGPLQDASVKQQLSTYINELKTHLWIGQSSLRSAEIPNTYIKIMTTDGLWGVTIYMLFIIFTMWLNLRLIHEIPNSHHYHRLFAFVALFTQVYFHALGVFTNAWALSATKFLFLYVVSIIYYMFDSYSRGLVPDDHSL